MTLKEILEPYKTKFIAEKLGVTVDMVRKYTYGISEPNIEKIMIISKITEHSIEEVVKAIAESKAE
ncbi:MAG: helix-turn-helix domain-containing protein [bacterium]